MGNQTLKTVMSSVVSPEFEKSSDIREKFTHHALINPSDNTAFTKLFDLLGQSELNSSEKRWLSEKMRDCFPHNSSMDFDVQAPSEDRWNHGARELWQSGYTSWQHNLAEIKGEGPQLAIGQNRAGAEFEYQFYSRCLLTCANFVLRFQSQDGGGAKDLVTYTQESLEQGNEEFGFMATTNTIFMHLLNGLTSNLAANTAGVLAVVDALLQSTQGISEGSLFGLDKEGLARDLIFKRVREFLLHFIEGEYEKGLKEKCVLLLTRIGFIAGNPEDLMRAAQFQLDFEIDISNNLHYFFSRSDKFIEPQDADEGQTSKFSHSSIGGDARIQNRCTFNERTDRQAITDKFACDGDYYYTWSPEYGLTRTKRDIGNKNTWTHEGEDGGQKRQVQNASDEAKGQFADFLVFKAKLFLRNPSCTDVPFKQLKKQTMQFDTEAPAVRFDSPETKKRFTWTKLEENPPMVVNGRSRWMGASPMAYDGKFIYTLCYYYDGDSVDHTKRKALFVEWWALSDQNVLSFVSEQQLFKETDNEPFIGRGNKGDSADGTYLNYGHLSCNGTHLCWMTRHNYHIFTVNTGLREGPRRNVFGSGGSAHLTCFDPTQSKFYGQDAAVYSWLEEFTISGFEARATEEEEEVKVVSLPELNYELDPIKARIKRNIFVETAPKRQADLLAQIIGGKLEPRVKSLSQDTYNKALQKAKEELEEEKKKVTEEDRKENLKEAGYVYQWTRAIIYAHVSKTAQEQNFHARNSTKQLDGESMLKFQKCKFAISVSEGMFQALRENLDKLLNAYDMDNAKDAERHALKNLLHIYIAHLGVLRPLRMTVRETLSEDEQTQQNALVEKLQRIQLFPGQDPEPAEDAVIEQKQLFQLHIWHLKKQLAEEIKSLIDSATVEQKLQELLAHLKRPAQGQSAEQRADLEASLRRYHPGEIVALFDEGSDEIKLQYQVIVEAGNIIEARNNDRIAEMMADKTKIEVQHQGYGDAVTLRLHEFVSNYLTELMVTYAHQNKIIIDNKLPEKRDDWTDEQKKKEDVINKNVQKATDKRKALTQAFFDMMVSVCRSFKNICKELANKIYAFNPEGWSEEDQTKLFKALNDLLAGKHSLLRTIALFVQQIQLYELSTTEIDEVHFALKRAVSGLNYYLAAGQTLNQQHEALKPAHSVLYDNLKFMQRHIAFGESSVAARLVNDSVKTVKSLEKFEILKYSIAQKFLPCLSQNCKTEIEGSFGIVKNPQLQGLVTRKVFDKESMGPEETFLEEFMRDQHQNQGIIKFDELVKNKIQALEQEAPSANGSVNGDESGAGRGNQDDADELNEITDSLVTQMFAIMVHFQNDIPSLKEAVMEAERHSDDANFKLEDIPEEHLQPLMGAMRKARKVKSWVRHKSHQIEEKCKKEATEEFKTKYASENPSNPKLDKLTEEQQDKIEDEATKKAVSQTEKALQDASSKLHFLRLFETRMQTLEVDADIAVEDLETSTWNDWASRAPHPDLEGDRENINMTAKQEEEDPEVRNSRIQDEIMGIIEDESTSSQLKGYIEALIVRGLRRVAGLRVFNKSLTSNTGDIFYDALHLWQAGLRKNKAKLAHFLEGVVGCGGNIEGQIREEFYHSTRIISEKLRVETDPQRLCQLLNALLWDYQSVDMQALAHADVFEALSGCPMEIFEKDHQPSKTELMNPLRQAWGREKNYHSLKSSDKTLSDMQTYKYDLPARLQQTFDYLTFKVYKFAFRGTEMLNDRKLEKILTYLLQQINAVQFCKIRQFLRLAAMNGPKSSTERDEHIRFDNKYGEEEGQDDTLMLDQYEAFPGLTVSEIMEKVTAAQNKKRDALDKFAMALSAEPTRRMHNDVEGQIKNRMRSMVKGIDADAKVLKAALQQQWHVQATMMNSVNIIREQVALPSSDDAIEVAEPELANADDDEKIAEIDAKTSQKEKVDAWLTHMRSRQGKEAGQTLCRSFSRVTIARILKNLTLMFSLSESNTLAAQIPCKTLKPDQLALLVSLSVTGSTSAQALCQKIFQSLMRIQIPVACLNQAVATAKEDGENSRVKQILSMTNPCMNMHSPFWQLLLNRVQLAKRAQFTTTYQVQVGLPVVVEEICRTFLVNQTLTEASHHPRIKQSISDALHEIGGKSEDAVATIFGLIPESAVPTICTGKRCQDNKGEQFVVLGFQHKDKEPNYTKKLHMVASKKSQVVGLMLNSSGKSKQQVKTYYLRNISAVPDIGEDVMPKKNRVQLQKRLATESHFLNPETLITLLEKLPTKEAIKANRSQALNYIQIFVQKGLFEMLRNLSDQQEYTKLLDQLGRLEALVQYLATTATSQTISAEEPLVGTNLLVVQAGEVQQASHHTALTTGDFTEFRIFIEDTNNKAAFIMRKSEDQARSEFMDLKIEASYGDPLEKSRCEKDADHLLSNYWIQNEEMNSDSTENCVVCKEDMNSLAKVTQKKTGFMRCFECTSDYYYCNKCRPKLQINLKAGLIIDINAPALFRVSRHEAVMIKSDDLYDLSPRILATLRMSNVVITDMNENNSIETLMTELNAIISADIYWKECAQIRIVEVKSETFLAMTKFIEGKEQPDRSTRGKELTKLYRNIAYVQKRVDAEDNLKFISKFLLEPAMSLEEFKESQIRNILTEEIAAEYEGEDRQLADETEKMSQALTALQEGQSSGVSVAHRAQAAAANRSRAASSAPDFMQKFTEESDKLFKDNATAQSMFYEASTATSIDYDNNFDELVFQSDDTNPSAVHRQQLHLNLAKLTQLMARSIWLQLLSQVNTSASISQSVNLTGKPQAICDLLHDANMAASHQNLFFGNPAPQKRAREQIMAILQYFEKKEGRAQRQPQLEQEGRKFRSFFYQDLLSRADLTIDQVRKENYTNLQEYNLKDLRKVSKLPNVLDPSNLLFFSKQMFERKDFLESVQRAFMAKILFDLHLGFAILFKSDEDLGISIQLIQGCSWALDMLKENIEAFAGQPESISKLLDGKNREMYAHVFDEMEKQSSIADKKRLMSEVLVKLHDIHADLQERNQVIYKKPLNESDNVRNLIQGYQTLVEGRDFKSQIVKMRLVALMNGPQSHLVYRLGQTYRTDNKMFSTYFQKEGTASDDLTISVDEMTAEKEIMIKNLTAKTAIAVGPAALRGGKPSSIRIKRNEQYQISFPVAPVEVWCSGKIYIRNQDSDSLVKTKYELLNEVTIPTAHVRARHHHVMFIGTDDSVMGFGYRAAGKEEGANQHKWKLIERPPECNNYQEMAAGKFFRLLLTKAGKLFFSGQNKKCCIGKDIEVNAYVDKFYDVTEHFPLESDDKIISADGGKHFIVLCTQKGKVYAAGNVAWNGVSDEVRQNSENNADYAFECRMNGNAEGYKAEKVWACDWYGNFWILAYKQEGEEKTYKTFCLGPDYDMVGCDDSDGAPKWRSPCLTEGRYFVEIASQGMYMFGKDQTGALWEFGDHTQENVSSEGENKMFKNHRGGSRRSCPYELVWFSDHGKTVLKIACGKTIPFIYVKDNASGNTELYALSKPSEIATENRTGDNYKKVYGEGLVLLSEFANLDKELVDMAMTRNMSFIVLKNKLRLPDGIKPNDPSSRELVHFWKKDGQWHFKSEEELAKSGRDALPEICFATRHPIANFDAIKDNTSILPDLEAIPKQQGRRHEPFNAEIKDPWSGAPLPDLVAQTLYYAKTTFNGETRVIGTTQDLANKGGQQWDVNPLVFYALRYPCVELDALPALDIAKLFEASTSDRDRDHLSFSISKSNINEADVNNVPVDRDTQKMLDDVLNFTPEQDMELLRAIDSYRKESLSDIDPRVLQPTQIDVRKLPLSAISPLKDVAVQTLQNRARLLVEFSQGVSMILPTTYFEAATRSESIQSRLEANSALLLPSVKMKLYIEKVTDYFTRRDEQASSDWKHDRKVSWEFWKLGLKNNPAFIKNSMLGQWFSQLLLSDPEFKNARGKGEGGDYSQTNQADDEPGGGKDWGWQPLLEQELMSDQVPLLIRIPNNRLKMGQKRDCWRLNPKVIKDDELKVYYFLGGRLARCSLEDKHLRVALAPTVWQLLLGTNPTLEDFALEDARLQKRLDKWQKAITTNSWPEDETWSYNDHLDDTKPVDPQKEATAALTQRELPDFRQKLVTVLVKETEKQMAHLQKGFKECLGDAHFMTRFLNWHDLMIVVEGRDPKRGEYDKVDRLKGLIKYVDCDEKQANKDQIDRFWGIYSKFNYEEKKNLFQFWMGRSRLHLEEWGDLQKPEYRIRLDPALTAADIPRSRPWANEIIFPETYESEEKFQSQLLKAMKQGCGLEPPPE